MIWPDLRNTGPRPEARQLASVFFEMPIRSAASTSEMRRNSGRVISALPFDIEVFIVVWSLYAVCAPVLLDGIVQDYIVNVAAAVASAITIWA